MNWLQTLIMLALAGLIIGGLARILLPGRETVGIFGTILAGLAGSFIGGLIMTYLFNSTNRWLTLAVAVGSAVLFILPFRMYYGAQTVVVTEAPRRRGFFGARSVDPGYGAYDSGYTPVTRRPFWSRRRTLF
ncbi:MAG TPA: GlsB/YeaQ/YmgE family stress response membrane protein [Actinomycetota bacterium]|nr:GlsB/YeaQ/YmgE family stress response membrane protein [Actinomycetota bacterium]